MSVCDRDRFREGGRLAGLAICPCVSVCQCVCMHVWVKFSDLSVERLHVCLLWALWLKEHGATYLVVMCCREMPLMWATLNSTKGKAGTHVLKTQLFKIHYASQNPLITLTRKECVHVPTIRICVHWIFRGPSKWVPCPCICTYTHLWNKPTICLFQFPPSTHYMGFLAEEMYYTWNRHNLCSWVCTLC